MTEILFFSSGVVFRSVLRHVIPLASWLGQRLERFRADINLLFVKLNFDCVATHFSTPEAVFRDVFEFPDASVICMTHIIHITKRPADILQDATERVANKKIIIK